MKRRIIDVRNQSNHFKFLTTHADRVTDFHVDIVRMHTIHRDLILILRQPSVQHTR